MLPFRFKFIFVFSIFIYFFILGINAECQTRTEFNLPDVLGYKVLKCDLHMHTMFSDGEVWPTLRAEEAWRQGLDAFAITDHIEDIYIDYITPESRNLPYDLAKPYAEKLNVTIIKGGEISKHYEPPGHLNAILVDDVDKLNHEYYKDAVKEANDQGGFVFWNHPGWKQHNYKSVWYKEQDTLYKNGWLHGIEVVNGIYYDPIAHQWCLDKGLTMMANTDAHSPTAYEYDMANGEHRTMTFVLAKENSKEAIKDGLFNQRTILYYQKILIGEEKYLLPLVQNSLEFSSTEITFEGRSSKYIFIKNNSSIDFDLEGAEMIDELRFPYKLKLPAGKTTIMSLRPKAKGVNGSKNISIPYIVKNSLVAPGKELIYNINFNVTFTD
ncbi:Sb-PDE family phosphodiesterase [Bacteroidota bacterium]